MSDTQEAPRFFWKSFELTLKQAKDIETIAPGEVFVETDSHPRTEEFLREAWK